MRINTEFYASTKLRDWYPIVKENFEIIQAKTNELEGKVNNAMTKRDVNMYFNQVLESTGTSINAVEELAKAIENSDQNVAEALQNLSGARLKAAVISAEDCPGTSIDAELGEENIIVFFEANVEGSPAEGAVTVLHMQTADYLFSNDTIYTRTSNGTWRDIHSEIQNEISIIKNKLKERPECLFGVYVGNGAEEREINLGFRPFAVEIYTSAGTQNGDGGAIYGGFFMDGYPLGNAAVITDNGFKVVYNIANHRFTNTNANKYYFKVYKFGKGILEIGKDE